MFKRYKLAYYWSLVVLCCFLVGCGSGLQQVQTSRSDAKHLYSPTSAKAFNFAIFGDRTGGDKEEGARVWRQAIEHVNQMHPDFVCTVGDLIWGYDNRPMWIHEAEEFAADTQLLQVPFYPVAGNHDVYWLENTENRPPEHHESDYENSFGPLWYAFEYQNCCFIILYSDEGDHVSGKKSFQDPSLQKMSQEQFTWLEETLQKAREADHVFVFLHQPRWRQGVDGENWKEVHQLLMDAGNVSACFAGHFHRPSYEQQDGIDYYTLGTTGAIMPKDSSVGHLFYWVNVQPDDYHVTGIPLNCVIEPKK